MYHIVSNCTETTGIVLDAGDGGCHSIPIYEGYAMPHATLLCNIGGRDLTKLFMSMLQDNTTFHTHTDLWHTSDNTVFGILLNFILYSFICVFKCVANYILISFRYFLHADSCACIQSKR